MAKKKPIQLSLPFEPHIMVKLTEIHQYKMRTTPFGWCFFYVAKNRLHQQMNWPFCIVCASHLYFVNSKFMYKNLCTIKLKSNTLVQIVYPLCSGKKRIEKVNQKKRTNIQNFETRTNSEEVARDSRSTLFVFFLDQT